MVRVLKREREEIRRDAGESSSGEGTQGVTERRVLRSRYLAIKNLISDEKEDISREDSDKFKSIITEVESLHNLVQKPREQVADAEVLLDIASTLVTLVRSQSNDGVTPADFVAALLRNFGQRDGHANFDCALKMICWEEVGSAVSHIFRKVPGCCTMVGPMSTQMKQRKAVVHRKRRPSSTIASSSYTILPSSSTILPPSSIIPPFTIPMASYLSSPASMPGIYASPTGSSVQKPREQVADAEVLLDIASTLVTLVRSQSNDGVTPADFLAALLRNFGQRDGHANFDCALKMICWEEVGSAVSHIFRKVPGCCTMVGPMSTQMKQREAVVHRKRRPSSTIASSSCTIPPSSSTILPPSSIIPPFNIPMASYLSSPASMPGIYASPTGSSETQTSTDLPVLYLDGDGFLPSHSAANAIVNIMRSHFNEPWVSWKKIPYTIRDMWFIEFKKRYRFVPLSDQWARKNFEKRGAACLKNLFANSRKNMERPSWLGDHVWDRLCEHWHTIQYQEKCEKAKQNRASDCRGFGASLHTAGSITISQHRYNMTMKTGAMPSLFELFTHTHQKKDKSWVDRRSEHISAEFGRNMNEAQSQRVSDSSQQQSLPSELDVWVRTVGGKKKGRIYGLGLESTALTGPSYFYSQALSCSQWMQSQELQKQVRKQVEAEWNSRVEVAERERDELRRRVEHNEKELEVNNRLLRELLTKINFQS